MSGGTFDVVIVGAGAAGCAAALSLPQGAKALLVDRAAPPGGRCCGGLLAPDGQAALAALGLELPPSVRILPEPRLVRVRDLDSGLEQTYRRHYFNLDRARFDAYLLELAARRTELRPSVRFVAMERDGDKVRVHLASGGREETASTRYVIGADGAGSAVRRAAFPDHPGPATMLAIQARLSADSPPSAGEPAGDAAYEVVFASRLTSFYAWAIPKPGSVLVGAAFDEVQGARRRFEEILRLYRERLGLQGEVLQRLARRLSRPRAQDELFAGAGGVLLAGEAAGLVSPSSGEGLSFALDSGAAAGRALASDSPTAAYAPTFRHLAGRVGRKLLKARLIFSPGWRRLALRLPWCP